MISMFESKYCPKIKNKFLIHEHHADRVGLHYDIRIEKDCVLKSWACRKLPELLDGKTKKILIIQQPDHKPNWFDFEGDIEEGYGKGKISIWDKGFIDIIKWDNHRIIKFTGTKINGTYVMINYLKPNQYLFFKKK